MSEKYPKLNTVQHIYTQRTYIHNTTKKSTTEKIEGPRLISNKSDTCYGVGIGNFSNRSVYIYDMECFKSYRFTKSILMEKTTTWEKQGYGEKQFEKSYVGGSEKNLILVQKQITSHQKTRLFEIEDFFSIGKYSNSKATDEFSIGSIALSHFLKRFRKLDQKNV